MFVGVAANGLAIVVNGGWMPVWGPPLDAAGMSAGELNVAFHRLLPTTLWHTTSSSTRGPIGDIIPIPLPYLTNVSSIGDAFIAAGLALVRLRDACCAAGTTRRAA